MLDLRNTGGALPIECDFPQSYTEIETRPKEGDPLQSGGVHTSERIWYSDAKGVRLFIRNAHAHEFFQKADWW